MQWSNWGSGNTSAESNSTGSPYPFDSHGSLKVPRCRDNPEQANLGSASNALRVSSSLPASRYPASLSGHNPAWSPGRDSIKVYEAGVLGAIWGAVGFSRGLSRLGRIERELGSSPARGLTSTRIFRFAYFSREFFHRHAPLAYAQRKPSSRFRVRRA